MAQSKISIGNDTQSGEPANGPKGPYITDDTDDEMTKGRGSDKSSQANNDIARKDTAKDQRS